MNNIQFGSICDIKKGTKIELLEDWSPEAVRFIQIDDLRNDNNLKYCLPASKYTYVDANDLIIAWDGANAGTVGYGLKGAIGSTLAKLKIKSDNYNIDFLGHFLKYKFPYLRENCTGATIPHINRQSLERIILPNFSFEIQQKIAHTLDTVSEILALRKKQLEKMDGLIQSIFYEMFGDPCKSESDWNVKTLGNIFQITSGGTPLKSRKEYYLDGTICWAKTGDLKEKYLYSVPEKITEDAIKNSSAKVFPPETVLVAMYGATIGACSILKINAATNQACAAFLPSDEVLPSYLYHFFENQKNNLIKMGVGGAQPNISATLLKEIQMVVPPLEIQMKFT